MSLTSRLSFLYYFFVLFIPFASSLSITGATGGIVSGSRIRPFRQEINEFSNSGASWDLFILALQRFQNTSITDELSYFQVVGIHGFPTRPWDGVAGENVEQGFCMHNSVLFPVWHRPYLALYEQILSHHAEIVANDYPSDQKNTYITAAAALRTPYWDWAIHPSLPDVVTSSTLSINTPQGRQMIPNPLMQYNFPVNMLESGYFPSYHNISRAPFTVRNLDLTTGESNQAAASASLVAQSAQSLSKVYGLFTSTSNYTFFASYPAGHESSLEGVHGDIHDDIGGEGFWAGHMTIIPMSSYDPVFWLHHANIDRLLALWQAIYPDDYVEPNFNPYGSYYQPVDQVDTINTPLAPFHSSNGSTMWTAATARDTAAFGYIYPEIIDWNISATDLAAQVRQKVNLMYSPLAQQNPQNTSSSRLQRDTNIAHTLSNIDAGTALTLGVSNLERQWFLRLTLAGLALKNSVAVYFFIGETDTTSASMWPQAPNLIGTYKPYTPSEAHRDIRESTQQAKVSFSHIVAAAVAKGVLSDIEVVSVLPFIKRHLTWRYVDRNGVEMASNSVPGIKIEILSRSVEPRKNMADFPIYGSYEVHQVLFQGS